MHRYVIIDTETSGLPLRAKKGDPQPAADAPGQPRLASFTALCTTPDLEIDEENSISTLIRPDGWVMPQGPGSAGEKNGLTTERLMAEGVSVKDVLAVYSEYISSGWIIVAHNAQFDTKIMRGELRRADMPDLFDRTPNICTMRATTEIMKLAPTHKQLAIGIKGFKPPKLMEIYQHVYGREFPDAHTSMADAKACLAILRWLIETNQCPEPSILYAKQPG